MADADAAESGAELVGQVDQTAARLAQARGQCPSGTCQCKVLDWLPQAKAT